MVMAGQPDPMAMGEAPYYLPIPSTQLGPSGYDTGALGVLRTVNITLVSGGGGNIAVVVRGAYGIDKTYALNSNQPLLAKHVQCSRLMMSGAGATVAGVVSWPDEIDPSSIAVSAPVTIAGTVNTDVGQGTQIAGGTTLQFGGTPIDPRIVTNTVSSNGTDTIPAVADTAIITPVSADVLNIIAPAGKRYRVEGIRTSVRNVSSTTFSLSQQTAQLYRASASGLASTFYNLFNDTTIHTLASNDVWLEWLEYSPPSGSFANYGSGGFGTPIGISGYALPNPIYLYPGDEVSLYVNIPTTGASASVYLQLLGRSEPL